jgi:periplasmic protein TonB
MAFEAVLAHTRGHRRSQRWRRVTLTLSVGVHVAALAVGAAYSLWQVDELPLPAVTVTLSAGAPPPPPPPPAARRASTKPKVRPVETKPDTLVQPREPKEAPKPQPEPENTPEGGVAGGVKGGVQGGVVGGVVGAPEQGPRMLAPQVAKGLLLIDPNDERYRVRLPPALERAGVTLSALLRICVSAQGAVTEVRILKGAGPAIDPQIPTVLGRWRYRPLLLDGRPTPFCTPLRYEITAR